MDGIVYYCRFAEKSKASVDALAEQLLNKGFFEFFGEKFEKDKVERTAYGKPYYAKDEKMQFNLSHCKNGVAAAFCGSPVGIDAEGMRRVAVRTAQKCCSRDEISYIFGTDRSGDGIWLTQAQAGRFLKLWTLKESYVKMTGEGLRRFPADVCFSTADLKAAQSSGIWEIQGPDAKSRQFLYLPRQEPLILALCTQAAGQFLWEEI